MRHLTRLSHLASLILVGFASAQGAETPAPPKTPETLTVAQVLSRRVIEPGLRFSPDGKRLAFTVREPMKGNERSTHVWMLDVAARRAVQFTNSDKTESQPRWSPDGRTLAFLSSRGKDGTQIFTMPVDGGEAMALTKHKTGVTTFDWSPDGKRLAFLATEPPTEAEEKRDAQTGEARVVDREDRQPRLWLFDLEKKEERLLVAGAWRISEVHWLPDGARLAAIASNRPAVDANTDRICLIDAATGEVTEPIPTRGPIGQLSVSPDGKFLAWIGARVDGPEPHDLWTAPVTGGPPRNITAAKLDRPVSGVWLDNVTLLGVAQNGFRTTIVKITTTGDVTSLPSPPDLLPQFVAAPRDGKQIAFSTLSVTRAPELWLANADGSAAVVVTDLNAEVAKLPLRAAEIFRYKSFDGVEIEAALLRPAGVAAGTRAPLAVLIHGGPTAAWVANGNPGGWGLAQLLAARGYAVFLPNIRGSTGYGQAFLELNRADWGGGDFKDVMAGVDHLIAKGIADGDRLGIEGWSYGGYMAAWAVTQTNRFKAAVVGAGLSDLASEFGTEDNPVYDEWFFGTPYEHLDKFTRSSPITFVKNVRTPTLIIHGEKDETDPIGQAQQFYRGVKRYLPDQCELVIYPREGHSFREEKHQMDRLERTIAWLDRYLKPAVTPK
jgi:dipeptidyl aminopeptidase/acylaminoacyl peptidase